ncbi:MAG: glycosyltransferase [Pseudonocardiaceae bacterium]
MYVTFGSVAAGLGGFGSMYAEVVAALAGLPYRVLLTTGAGGDPAGLEPWPGNVHVERWWPQAEVMPMASAVVGHGGFGTTMTALAAGVPQVVLPLFAFDQTVNALRVAETGVGVHIGGGPEDVAAIPAAVSRVLSDESFRRAAEGVAAEIASLPDVSAAVPILEAIAVGEPG